MSAMSKTEQIPTAASAMLSYVCEGKSGRDAALWLHRGEGLPANP
jgi:hypothetical protein